MTTYDQPTLHLPPSPAEAKALGDEASRAAWEAADKDWKIAAERFIIWHLQPGEQFLAEDVVLRIGEYGYQTSNAKAIGHVMKDCARRRLIEKTTQARPARTSHGSLKPVWRRLETYL